MVVMTLFEEEDVPTILSPRELEVIEISAPLACALNARWHSILPEIHWSNVVRNRDYICFGVLHRKSSSWCAVGIWSTPIAANRMANKGVGVLELRRLAIAPYAPKNTATWCMARMIRIIKSRLPHIELLISYQDTSVHLGTIYKAGNWVRSGEVSPTPWNNKYRKRRDIPTTKKVRWEYRIARRKGATG